MNWYDLERELAVLATEHLTPNGMYCDLARLDALERQLAEDQVTADAALQVAFPPMDRSAIFLPKRNNAKKGFIAGQPIEKRWTENFNPASGQHIARWLCHLHDWRPTEFTDSGNPKTSAAVLRLLPYPEAKVLCDRKLIAKRHGMVGSYRNALDEDGIAHTEYMTLGALSGRCSHKSPNIAQVPKCLIDPQTKHAVRGLSGGYGWEFRDLFAGPPGWLLVGADQAQLELRGFAHYLAPYDGGAYANLVCYGDAHSINASNVGIDRNTAKTLIYAALYGAGYVRLGHIIDPLEDSDSYVRAIGREAKRNLIAGIAGMGELLRTVERSAGRGYLIGLDGRLLQVREVYSALNLLIQSAGAIVCKRWVLLIEERLQHLRLHHGNDYRMQAFIHDELQTAARNREIAEIVAATCKQAAIDVGELYHMDCPTDGDAKIGERWCDTH